MGKQFNEWTLDDGRMIILLTVDELKWLKREAPATRLLRIDGTEDIAERVPEDALYGYVFYGRLP
jgi:hypothetical protein